MREKQTHTLFFFKKKNKKPPKRTKKTILYEFFLQSTKFNTFKDFANSCFALPPNLFTLLLFYF